VCRSCGPSCALGTAALPRNGKYTVCKRPSHPFFCAVPCLATLLAATHSHGSTT
jgi:hypothetical protein